MDFSVCSPVVPSDLEALAKQPGIAVLVMTTPVDGTAHDDDDDDDDEEEVDHQAIHVRRAPKSCFFQVSGPGN